MADRIDIPRQCHCGWMLPAELRLTRVYVGTSETAPVASSLSAEIAIACPLCDCTFCFERRVLLVSRENAVPRQGGPES